MDHCLSEGPAHVAILPNPIVTVGNSFMVFVSTGNIAARKFVII